MVTQQEVICDRRRDVQEADSCVTSGPEMLTQSAATEMLQRARASAMLTQQLEEGLVLLRRGALKKRKHNQLRRTVARDNEQRGGDD